MRSIDYLNIVVFVGLFFSSSIFVNSAPRNHPNGLNPRRTNIGFFFNPILDPNNYLKLSARIGETIDIPVVCPQSKEAGDKFALVYRVESRHEFDNCLIDTNKLEDKIVGLLECEGSKPLQTEKFDINVLNNSPIPNYDTKFEEGKEYYYISTSYGPGDQFDRPCDRFFVRFSITIEQERNFFCISV